MEPPVYTFMSSKATMLKSLYNELAACSADLQQMVSKRGILKKTKLPLEVTDLRQLAVAAMGTLLRPPSTRCYMPTMPDHPRHPHLLDGHPPLVSSVVRAMLRIVPLFLVFFFLVSVTMLLLMLRCRLADCLPLVS
jgi:hypothetical protein